MAMYVTRLLFAFFFRYFLQEQRKYPTAVGDLTQLLVSIQSACKAISAAVRRAGISKLFGTAGDVNVQGEFKVVKTAFYSE